MIILHNSYDPNSVAFVESALASYPTIEVLDWYNPEDFQQWVNAGGTLQVSAFPSVVLDMVSGGVAVIRIPDSIDDAVLKKKYAEAEYFIRAEDYVNAQTWIDELDGEGVDVTVLQAWLDEVKTP